VVFEMSEAHLKYADPLVDRYDCPEMSYIFSNQKKFSTWRQLWVWLAKSEMELGIASISPEQIEQMEAHIDTLDLEAAARAEKDTRHDVMAHIRVFAEQCPLAAPIIHLGATSCFVGDNTDLMCLREALDLLLLHLARVISRLAAFADQYKDMATLAYTHLQPAQPTTVGKRACLWLADLVMVEEELRNKRDQLRFRGVKGTTGTQASFLQLFDGDGEKVAALDRKVAALAGFSRCYPVTGQTYSRLVDAGVLCTLALLGSSLQKMCGDLRMLASFKEVEEPFGKNQVGSSAMAYKRNPMRLERATALGRALCNYAPNALQTHASQWMERTLDDSANRRITLPPAFLCADVALLTLQSACEGLVVYPKVVAKRLRDELPFMATESILMATVAAGGDRQECHEEIRRLSQEAAEQVKGQGLPNDLEARIRASPYFARVAHRFDELFDPASFVGRAPQQVAEFLAGDVAEVLQRYEGRLDGNVELAI